MIYLNCLPPCIAFWACLSRWKLGLHACITFLPSIFASLQILGIRWFKQIVWADKSCLKAPEKRPDFKYSLIGPQPHGVRITPPRQFHRVSCMFPVVLETVSVVRLPCQFEIKNESRDSLENPKRQTCYQTWNRINEWTLPTWAEQQSCKSSLTAGERESGNSEPLGQFCFPSFSDTGPCLQFKLPSRDRRLDQMYIIRNIKPQHIWHTINRNTGKANETKRKHKIAIPYHSTKAPLFTKLSVRPKPHV